MSVVRLRFHLFGSLWIEPCSNIHAGSLAAVDVSLPAVGLL